MSQIFFKVIGWRNGGEMQNTVDAWLYLSCWANTVVKALKKKKERKQPKYLLYCIATFKIKHDQLK